jgi:hypothetical protein
MLSGSVPVDLPAVPGLSLTRRWFGAAGRRTGFAAAISSTRARTEGDRERQITIC